MTAKHRVMLVWTTIYSFSWQSERNCLELGAQSGKETSWPPWPGAAGRVWQGIVTLSLTRGVAGRKGGAFGVPSLTAPWSCSSWDTTCHSLAQQRDNDTGWHQPASLFIFSTLQLVPNREPKLPGEASLIPLKTPHQKQPERELSLQRGHPLTELAEDGPRWCWADLSITPSLLSIFCPNRFTGLYPLGF